MDLSNLGLMIASDLDISQYRISSLTKFIFGNDTTKGEIHWTPQHFRVCFYGDEWYGDKPDLYAGFPIKYEYNFKKIKPIL